jgi:hypothetical protein
LHHIRISHVLGEHVFPQVPKGGSFFTFFFRSALSLALPVPNPSAR